MLSKINQTAPLVHCITNYVVANFTANGLLAIGASPIMADEMDEIADVVSAAQGVLINIGTINNRTIGTMLAAGEKANALKIPIVLDPVGVGISDYRKKIVEQLLQNVQFDLIKCNAGELAVIAKEKWETKGVDRGTGTMNIAVAARKVALKYRCKVIVTGATDYLTDGQEDFSVTGGSEMATRITGTGCLLGAICTATLASETHSPLMDLRTTLQDFKQAAEQQSNDVGTFVLGFMNELQQIAEGRK